MLLGKRVLSLENLSLRLLKAIEHQSFVVLPFSKLFASLPELRFTAVLLSAVDEARLVVTGRCEARLLTIDRLGS